MISYTLAIVESSRNEVKSLGTSFIFDFKQRSTNTYNTQKL